jgi:hypothetical protein
MRDAVPMPLATASKNCTDAMAANKSSFSSSTSPLSQQKSISAESSESVRRQLLNWI